MKRLTKCDLISQKDFDALPFSQKIQKLKNFTLPNVSEINPKHLWKYNTELSKWSLLVTIHNKWVNISTSQYFVYIKLKSLLMAKPKYTKNLPNSFYLSDMFLTDYKFWRKYNRTVYKHFLDIILDTYNIFFEEEIMMYVMYDEQFFYDSEADSDYFSDDEVIEIDD